MNQKISYFLITFFLISPVLQAQYTNLKFENFDTTEGLSSSTCTEIFQDSDGFLWFGTIDGLNKYNGYEFKTYRPELNDPTSISNNRISSIVEDGKGQLWIGTSNGLNVFDRKTEKFHRIHFYKNDSSTINPSAAINELLYDEVNNQLWIGTKNGLIKLSLHEIEDKQYKEIEFHHYKNNFRDSTSIDNNNVTNLVKDKDNVIWAGTDGTYLNKYNPGADNFDLLFIEVDDTFELNQLPKQVLVDDKNNFWIGNNLAHLIYWDNEKDTFQRFSLVEKDIAIFDLYQDANGVIWIATDGHGIYLFDKEKGVFQHLEHQPEDPFSLPNNQPSKVLEDADGIFWIATYNKGVSKQAPAKSSFGHYFYQYGSKTGLSTKIAQSVLEDSKGRLWIGTDGGGLNLFEEETGAFRHFRADSEDPTSISSDKILYLSESIDGSIWIGTWDGGLSKFDPQKKTAINYKYNPADEHSLGQNTVWCAVEDAVQRVWIGTQTEGLNLFDPETEKFYKYKNIPGDPQSLISDFVFSLYIDSADRLFVGTSTGLCVVDLQGLEGKIPEEINFREIKHENIRGNRINYITEDDTGNIWVGTDIGLYKLSPGLDLLHTYSSHDGLPNNLIVGIVEDNNTNLWITTKSGLSLLDPNTHTFKNFNVHDGLQGMEFQSKSIDKTQNGRVIIGGINGFNIFDPDKISLASKDIKPIITNFRLFNRNIKVGDTVHDRVLLNKSISEVNNIELKHDETYLAFEFVALNYQNPERVNYSYRMKGLDENFIKAGINRTANYSNLPPGNYTFEVKAAVDEEWEKAESSTIDIQVLSPPWLTWWAYLLYFLFFTGILWTIFWYYSNKVKEEKEHELDQMKLRFFINVSHEFRTPLTLILNPVDKILSAYSDPEQVKNSALTIQRSARRLLYLINQLLDFRKMEMGMAPLELSKLDIVEFSKDIFSLFEDIAKSKNIQFEFQSSVEEYKVCFDPDKYEKVITNLISNALKFTNNGGSVKFSVSKTINCGKGQSNNFFKGKKTEEYVEIRISDTGVGFKREQLKEVFSRFFHIDNTKTGTGIGLNFTKALVELHGGQITVESEFQKGSVFTLCLPVEPKLNGAKINSSGGLKNIGNLNEVMNTVKSAEYEIGISDESDGVDMEEKPEADKPVLLIVEDNKELRLHLKNELKGNFTIKEAQNGSVGYEKVKRYFPDIIISDVMMPEMDGFELCRLIKNNLETCHIPVVLLTARTLGEDRIEGYGTGADEYLPKPFNIHILKARLKNLLEAKRRLREKFTSISGVAATSEVATNSLDEAFLDKATKVIVENMGDPDFQLEDLIKEMGIGRSQFYRKISAITGQNPSNFIRTIKLKYASELLLQNKYSIKEITHMTGFNSSAYFSKTFKELFDMTPTQFLQQNNRTSN